MRAADALACLMVLALASCGDRAPASPSAPAVASVRFTLHSPVLDPPDDPFERAQIPYCKRNLLGRSTLVFGFSSQTYYLDETAPRTASVVVPDVPAGRTHVVVIRDIYACEGDPHGEGITVEGLSADGVPLTAVTTFPLTGTPALRFTVGAGGQVTP